MYSIYKSKITFTQVLPKSSNAVYELNLAHMVMHLFQSNGISYGNISLKQNLDQNKNVASIELYEQTEITNIEDTNLYHLWNVIQKRTDFQIVFKSKTYILNKSKFSQPLKKENAEPRMLLGFNNERMLSYMTSTPLVFERLFDIDLPTLENGLFDNDLIRPIIKAELEQHIARFFKKPASDVIVVVQDLKTFYQKIRLDRKHLPSFSIRFETNFELPVFLGDYNLSGFGKISKKRRSYSVGPIEESKEIEKIEPASIDVSIQKEISPSPQIILTDISVNMKEFIDNQSKEAGMDNESFIKMLIFKEMKSWN